MKKKILVGLAAEEKISHLRSGKRLGERKRFPTYEVGNGWVRGTKNRDKLISVIVILVIVYCLPACR